MVAGTLALLKAKFPGESYLQLINRLLSSTDSLTSLAGKCQTGGRLNLYGALNSASARPANDDFVKAFKILIPSGKTSITAVDNNVDATKESGEPNHAGNVGGKSIWWYWIAPNTTPVTIKTEGSGFDTLLGVYTGSSVSALATVTSNNDGCQCGTSQVTITPTNGVTYSIAVDGYNGASGTVKLTIQTTSSPQNADLKFDLTSLQRTGSQFQAELDGRASATVEVQRSSELQSWTVVTSIQLDGNGAGIFTDTFTPFAFQFYRARITAAPAQLSCNVVGYVDMSFPAGNSMFSNPLTGYYNQISALIPNPPTGATIYKWDDVNDVYISNTFFGTWSNPDMTFLPGEGGIFNPGGSTYTRTFKGVVPQGYLINATPTGLSIRSSKVPQAGRVTTDLGLAMLDFDNVYRMVNGNYVVYTYANGAWSPSEPSVNVGESFWINRGTALNWSRNFLIWP